MPALKQEMIAFKADGALLDALSGMPNRSEFIRAALFEALGGTCPLCRGTGMLSVRQREHWDEFARDHSVKVCGDCHELKLVCGKRRKLRSSKGG